MFSTSKPQLLLTKVEAWVCSNCQATAAKWGEECVNRARKWGSLTQYMQPLHQAPQMRDSTGQEDYEGYRCICWLKNKCREVAETELKVMEIAAWQIERWISCKGVFCDAEIRLKDRLCLRLEAPNTAAQQDYRTFKQFSTSMSFKKNLRTDKPLVSWVKMCKERHQGAIGRVSQCSSWNQPYFTFLGTCKFSTKLK